MRNFIIGLLVGLVISASFAYAQYFDSQPRNMPGSMTPYEQQDLYNRQQQLNMLPPGPQIFVQPGHPC